MARLVEPMGEALPRPHQSVRMQATISQPLQARLGSTSLAGHHSLAWPLSRSADPSLHSRPGSAPAHVRTGGPACRLCSWIGHARTHAPTYTHKDSPNAHEVIIVAVAAVAAMVAAPAAWAPAALIPTAPALVRG